MSCSEDLRDATIAVLASGSLSQRYDGEAEQMCDYFPSSGAGQVDVEFHIG